MFDRYITEKLQNSILRTPAVAILGPRQVGKTTLARIIGENRPSIYLDLESPQDLAKLDDPIAFFTIHSDKLIILDEIQRTPNIFMILRGLIDKHRLSGKKGEQFLLLGSASMELLRQSSESLAGRIHCITMSGFNCLEIDHRDPSSLQKLWLRGGFPESYLAASDIDSLEWREMLVRTYLERDIPQMGFRIPAERLRRLWTMLAHLQGEAINYSSLANNLEVSSKVIAHYLDILVDLLLVERLEPWHQNVKKRLVKSPRFYIKDSGIVHHLLGIARFDELLSNPILSKSWEGFAISNILSVLPNHVKAHYYRTASGAEIDLVLTLSSTERWAIEIKYGLAPKVGRGFHQAVDDVSATRKWVVYSGDETFPIQHDITVVSLAGLLKILSEM